MMGGDIHTTSNRSYTVQSRELDLIYLICIQISCYSLCIHACLCVWERERVQCQCAKLSPSLVLSTSPHLSSLSHDAEQRGVRKASLSLPLPLHLSASVHHSWVGNVKQTVIAPLLDILSMSSTHQIEWPVHALYWLLLNIRAPYLGVHVFDINSFRISFWYLQSPCAAVIARFEGHYSWTLESDDSPERQNKDARRRPRGLHHFNMSHTPNITLHQGCWVQAS